MGLVWFCYTVCTMPDLKILLANDDIDDCVFFRHALDELSMSTHLTAVYDGEQLLRHLENEKNALPDILFLDLYMPRINGFECLSAIKANERLSHFPVVVFSTSSARETVNRLYDGGAQYFVRKPTEYINFKKIIQQALLLIAEGSRPQPGKDHFVLSLDNAAA